MKRNRYYTGKHLTAESFLTEQDFYCQKQLQLANLIFGRIVVTGYAVSRFCEDTVSVSPGIAFDGNGRLLRMTSERKLPLPSVKGFYYQQTLTLYVRYDEQTDNEYIEETVQFFFTDDAGGVPLADIFMKDGEISAVEMKPRSLDSIFSSLMVSGIKEVDALKQELYHMSKRTFEKFHAMQRQINHNTIVHGTAIISGNDRTVLISDRISLPHAMEPFFVTFSVLEENCELLYGDFELFPPTAEPRPIIRVIKKAVKILPSENSFLLAIEIDKPAPGKDILLRWIATGEERWDYAKDMHN
ncbi:MAG: hypothetical protein LBR74_01530 [Eubacterium sp.]|jgi:hypothetical protein|nr:hypothetical protein [Eubacterium sp.]